MIKKLRVKPVNLGAKPKAKKRPRRSRQAYACYKCDRNIAWPRSQLRMRRQMYYCPDHLKAFDEKHNAWPSCPNCGGNEFGVMKWNGSVEKTTALCTECGFIDHALQHFDKLTIRMTASPVVRH